MKNLAILFTAIILSLATFAQVPAGINYQTVVRDADGNILADTEVSLQMSIRTQAPDGEIVYQETHDAATNAFGLVNLVIGTGNPQIGTFANINWGDGDKYLETAIDADGSGTYTILGVTQFLSVPYSYESEHSRSLTLTDDNGNEYKIKVDTLGNLNSTLIVPEWYCGEDFTDARDGQTYSTVLIGDQCWMAENLAYLPSVSPSSQGNNTDSFFYVYDYQGTDVTEAKASTNYQTYGVLYNWPASLTACPEGWHLPSDAEWTDLTDYVSSQLEFNCNGNTSYIAKALAATTNWNSSSTTCAVGNNLSANNASGFSGLPGGIKFPEGFFFDIADSGTWWSSTESSISYVWWVSMVSYGSTIGNYENEKEWGFSVRCVRN